MRLWQLFSFRAVTSLFVSAFALSCSPCCRVQPREPFVLREVLRNVFHMFQTSNSKLFKALEETLRRLNMYVYIYIYIYVCVCAYTERCVCVYMCTSSAHTHTYIYIYIHGYTCARTYIIIHIYICVCMHLFIYLYTYLTALSASPPLVFIWIRLWECTRFMLLLLLLWKLDSLSIRRFVFSRSSQIGMSNIGAMFELNWCAGGCAAKPLVNDPSSSFNMPIKKMWSCDVGLRPHFSGGAKWEPCLDTIFGSPNRARRVSRGCFWDFQHLCFNNSSDVVPQRAVHENRRFADVHFLKNIFVWGICLGRSYAMLLHHVRLASFGSKVVPSLEVPIWWALVRRKGRCGWWLLTRFY